MRRIRIETSRLKAVLEENRSKHKDVFERAMVGYREAAIKELDQIIADARAGKKIKRSLSLIQPVDQTADYDRALRMLDLTADDVVELEEHEFDCYVMDKWHWRNQFLSSNSAYVAGLPSSDEEEGLI